MEYQHPYMVEHLDEHFNDSHVRRSSAGEPTQHVHHDSSREEMEASTYQYMAGPYQDGWRAVRPLTPARDDFRERSIRRSPPTESTKDAQHGFSGAKIEAPVYPYTMKQHPEDWRTLKSPASIARQIEHERATKLFNLYTFGSTSEPMERGVAPPRDEYQPGHHTAGTDNWLSSGRSTEYPRHYVASEKAEPQKIEDQMPETMNFVRDFVTGHKPELDKIDPTGKRSKRAIRRILAETLHQVVDAVAADVCTGLQGADEKRNSAASSATITGDNGLLGEMSEDEEVGLGSGSVGGKARELSKLVEEEMSAMVEDVKEAIDDAL